MKEEILSEDKKLIAIIHKHIFKFPGSQDKKEMMDDDVFTVDKSTQICLKILFLALKFRRKLH